MKKSKIQTFLMTVIAGSLVIIVGLLIINLKQTKEKDLVKENPRVSQSTVKTVSNKQSVESSQTTDSSQSQSETQSESVQKKDINEALYNKTWTAKNDEESEIKVVFKKDGTYDWLMYYLNPTNPNFQSESGHYTINSAGHIELTTIETRVTADYHTAGDILEVAPKEEPQFMGVGNDQDEKTAKIDSSDSLNFWFRNEKLHSDLFYHKDFTVINEQLPSTIALGNKVVAQYKEAN